jgi:hypothetical protein
MPVASSTIGGVNTWTFSGAITDAEIKAAWAGLVVNGVYVLNRAIYLDNTADMSAVTGGLLTDFGTQVNPGIILHTGRDKTKSTFRNFTFLIRTGLSVPNRGNLVTTWNGSAFISTSTNGDGLSQDGGGFVYGVPGNPGGGDPRFLLELAFDSISNVTTYSQEFTEQELQILVNQSKVLRGLIFEKAYGFPQIGTPVASTGVVVYRSTMNTQSASGGGLIPIRLLPTPAGSGRYASVCYVDSYLTRNSEDINTRLIDTFSSSATNRAHITILNNYTRGTWFGTTKTNFPAASNWVATNTIYGGVLKKLQFVGGNGGVVRAYDSRSTTAAQKCKFAETGFVDFLDTNLAPTTDSEGKIQLTHIGAIATGSTLAIVRYTGQRYTFQKFGYRVMVATPDMSSGDNDLSAFTPVILTAQEGLERTEAEINAATTVDSFQELLEELHVLALAQVGAASYNAFGGGNLFTYDGSVLTTNFSEVLVDATAASKITYSSSTNRLTIRSSVMTDTDDVTEWRNPSGTISLANGAQIQGVYASSAGTATVWEFQDVEVGSSLALYNSSGTTLYYRDQVTSAGDYAYYIPPGTTGTYTWAIELYGKQRQSGTFAANTGGLLFYVPIYVEDVGITETTKATVAAYTEIENSEKFYDYTAYFRLGEQGIKIGQMVTRSGTSIEVQSGLSHVIRKTSSIAVYAVTGGVITTKAEVYAGTTKYSTEILVPPATLTAHTTEIITIAIQDANGDSQVTINGGDGNFELWKVTTATATADYATGTLLATVGNGIYRFIGVSGFDIVGVDTNSNIRRRTSMAKGIYTQAFYVGDQIQLAQAPEVLEILTKVEILQVAVDDLPQDIMDTTVETGATVVESLRLHNSVLGGKVSGGGSATETFRDLADTKDRLVSSVTETGNRTAEVYDLT